jgi:subtilisin family serine protease
MKRTLTYLALLVAALLLAACGNVTTPRGDVPRADFQPVEQVSPSFNPFTGESATPQAELPTVWFFELAVPTQAEIGTQAAAAFDAAFGTLQSQAAAQGVAFEPRYTFNTLISGFSAELEPSEVLRLASLPGVTRVMPVAIVEAPNVTRHDPNELTPQLTTALSMTGADIVQSELGFTGAGVKVGIIDTGIMLTHPEFTGRITAGFDFVGDFYNAGDPENNVPVPQPGAGTRPGGGDCNGHGTHVAGIVGAGGAELTGVAPEVELGAYRVFGCTGSSHSDVILAAIELAFADGMDVVNLSLGSSNGWAQDFLSVALSRMLDFGMIPVASAGNNGASGIYTIGAPGAGENVITVASFDNIGFETNVFEVAGQTIGYTAMTGSLAAPSSGSEEIVFIGRACDGDTLEADPDGKVALAVRGACTFAEKALNAEAAGATAVVIHNNAPGNFAGTLGGVAVDVPVVSISQEDGQFIRAQDPPVTLIWLEGTDLLPNPTGNLISTFSSYGLTPELTLKPDIGAPGGLINSPIIENPIPGDPDSGDAAYAVLSGTSMSAPHVAGAVALMLEARPEVAPNRVRDLLMNVAEPKPWSLNPALGFALDSVHRQGAGMLRIDNAILNRTYAVPAKLSLGESAQGPYTDVITLHNDTHEDVSYALTQIEALGLFPIATTGNSNNPGFAAAAPLVEYFKLRQSTIFEPISEITVPAGGTASFQVRITANPNLPDSAVYGTYLVFLPQNEVEGAMLILVPAAGFKGDYQQLPVFTFPPFLAFVDEEGNVFILPEGQVFTMRDGDVPTFGFALAHAVQRATAQFIPLGERSWMGAQPAFEAELVRRNNPGSVYVFGLGSFDASVLPDGEYKIRLEVLKALGDPTNPNHVVTVETPRFVIDRSLE